MPEGRYARGIVRAADNVGETVLPVWDTTSQLVMHARSQIYDALGVGNPRRGCRRASTPPVWPS
jgi:hypothetical protein